MKIPSANTVVSTMIHTITSPHGNKSRAIAIKVAHRPGWRLFIDDGDPLAGLPKIRIVYRVLGDMIFSNSCFFHLQPELD